MAAKGWLELESDPGMFLTLFAPRFLSFENILPLNNNLILLSIPTGVFLLLIEEFGEFLLSKIIMGMFVIFVIVYLMALCPALTALLL